MEIKTFNNSLKKLCALASSWQKKIKNFVTLCLRGKKTKNLKLLFKKTFVPLQLRGK